MTTGAGQADAIVCDEVWKSYRIYKQRSHSLKEFVLARRTAYRELWAIEGVSFRVPPGSTLGIIGPNGSGKSTLLKVLAGILTPNRGSVTVRGTISSLLELGTGFHPELTGRENVFLASSLLGMDRRQVETRYDSIVEFAGLHEFMDLPVKNYSSGMYARLAFSVAISVDPDVLLIDEVLAVGDESFQMRCYERIAEFRSAGKTIVLVSHSLDAIRSLCRDAIWLDHGHVQASGPAHDVVASYLGAVHEAEAQREGPPPSGERWGSMDAEIEEVAFLDDSGEPRQGFRTGDPMRVRVRFTSHRPITDISCGISVNRAVDLAHLWGQNTYEAGARFTADGRGTIEWTIDSLPLLRGQYLVSVALHDAAVKRVYDWHERRYSFVVFESPSMAPEGGSMHMDGRWSVDAGAAVAPTPGLEGR